MDDLISSHECSILTRFIVLHHSKPKRGGRSMKGKHQNWGVGSVEKTLEE